MLDRASTSRLTERMRNFVSPRLLIRSLECVARGAATELLAGSISMCNKQNYLALAQKVQGRGRGLGRAAWLHLRARFRLYLHICICIRPGSTSIHQIHITSSHACCRLRIIRLFTQLRPASPGLGFNGTFNSSVVLALTTFVSLCNCCWQLLPSDKWLCCGPLLGRLFIAN